MSATPAFDFEKTASDYRALNGPDRKQRRETIVATLLAGAGAKDLNGDGPALVKDAFRLADLIISESERR